MTEEINEKASNFQQMKAALVANVAKLKTLEQETAKQETVLTVLKQELEALNANVEQGGIDEYGKPKTKEFAKLAAKQAEFDAKTKELEQFKAITEKQRTALKIALSDEKTALINQHADLMERYGNQMIAQYVGEFCQQVSPAVQAVESSNYFTQALQVKENILRADISPREAVLEMIFEQIRQQLKGDLGESDFIQTHTLPPEVNQIETISPMKAKQLRGLLT